MKTIHTGTIFFCLLCFLTVNKTFYALSETLPEPIYKTTRPDFKEIKEEAVYQYLMMDYRGKVKLDLVEDESHAKYDTPEESLISFFSAIYQGDYDWWLSSWTKKSQSELKEEFSEDELTENWKSFYEDTYVALISRIETGKYVLLYYNAASKDRNKIIQRQTIAFVKEDGRWLATNELSSDPVFLYWQEPKYKAHKVGRELLAE